MEKKRKKQPRAVLAACYGKWKLCGILLAFTAFFISLTPMQNVLAAKASAAAGEQEPVLPAKEKADFK